MCIRMIPPEDVSVGTISATQSTSPITTGQCTASSCQTSTTIPIGGTPVTGSPVTGSPVTTTPATVTTAPATMAPGSLCTTCDIATIAPAMEANTVFENTNTVGADGCTQTNVICRRTDDQKCTGVTLSATNAAGTSTISSAMNANQVSGSLTCQADGTYSSGSVTGITKLACTFDTCVPACSTCDTEAAKPVMDPPNTEFQITDRTPAGQTCKVYSAACVHATQQCTVTIYATMGSGSEEMLSSDVDTDLTAATINCATDGTLAFMGR
ncbi:hypothetical protein GCK72_021476 [Caenorhabditis remanei]|uniref:DUF281 domain-containing protein n=1 Tax=Caenorhabditis remanei TaxID=31234 RepID=A0A6A5GJX4_CAERE|nr:hypothetical protein GCK72_021476 [Caenorhabditis remanei]KAF1754911.1 hypothetical protein GCK72_021476 [Caenorhabditis remanei]